MDHAAEAIRRAPRMSGRDDLLQHLDAMIAEALRYSREHFHDPPEIRDWMWSES